MWRRLLRAYVLTVGVSLVVLGLAGFASVPFNLTAPENVFHLGVGLTLFAGGLLLRDDPHHLRDFLGGMGLLLVLGKGTIVTARWMSEGSFHLPVVGVVCLVAGLFSLLLALFVGKASPPED